MSRKFRRHWARSQASGSDARLGNDENPSGGERLQKVLAAAGVGSRRDCEELIRDGRVEVDRKVVTELGTRVDPLTQEIRVDGEALRRPKRLYFVVNKPEGVVTTNYDQSGRPRVVDLVPTQERVFAVGRLDMASEGLILVTNDGEFANRLTHPRYGVPKTYLVRVAGTPSQAELAKLRRGIHLAEGLARVNALHVKGKHKGSTDMVIVLNEGRNREIRRILARIGHKVLRLKRIAVGRLKLSDLPVGAWRRLMPAEIEMLLSEAQERKRERRGPKRPAGAGKPVQGRREPSPYLPDQAAMAPGPMGGELEDDWGGDDDFLGGDDEGMIEITDTAATFGGRPPRGDVIDYDEAPAPAKRPAKGDRQTPKPHAQRRKAGGRTTQSRAGSSHSSGRTSQSGSRAAKSGGRGSQSNRRPAKGNRPAKYRPKGRR